jgi:hypothetical protein
MAAGRSMSNARMPARAAEGVGDGPGPNMGGVSLRPVADCADVKGDNAGREVSPETTYACSPEMRNRNTTVGKMEDSGS